MLSKRKVYLDALKIIAIFFVIFNHLYGYTLYQYSNSFWETWIYMFITMFTRINVPLFIMISGSLLLKKEKNKLNNYMIKKISQIIIIIFVFNTIIYLFSYGNCISLLDWFVKISSGKIEGSYWFLYEYLGMLIMLPFLRSMANNFKKHEFYYLLFFHFVVATLIPMLKYIVQIKYDIVFTPYISLPIMQEKFIFYLLIGYYIDNELNISQLNKKKIVILIFFSVIGIIISSGFTYHQGIHAQFTQEFVQLFDYITAIVVFIIVKYLFTQKNLFSKNFQLHISRLASLVFGIYLLDPILKKLLYKYIDNLLRPVIPTIFISFIWCIVSMFIGGVIVYFFKKIPTIIRKYYKQK